VPRSSIWSLSFRFTPQQPFMPLSPSATCDVPCPSNHPPWFYDPNNIWWRVEVMTLFIMPVSSPSCHSFLGPHIFLGTLFLNYVILCFLLNVKDQVNDYYSCYGRQPNLKCSVMLLNSRHMLQSHCTDVIFRLLSCGLWQCSLVRVLEECVQNQSWRCMRIVCPKCAL
jgi:hypothetical protein